MGGHAWALGWVLQLGPRPKVCWSRSSAAHDPNASPRKRPYLTACPTQRQPKTSILLLLPGQQLADSLPVPGDGVTARLPRRSRSTAPRHCLRLQPSTLQPATLSLAAPSADCSLTPRRRPAAGVRSPLQQQALPEAGRQSDMVRAPDFRSLEGGKWHHSPAHGTAPALLCSAAGCSRLDLRILNNIWD